MPITLPKISRRSFLKGAFAGTLLPGSLLAAEGERSPDVWAFFADTHIHADRTRRGGNPPVCPVEHLETLRADVLIGTVGKPSGLIVVGDCARLRGLPGDYDTLFAEFKPFQEAGIDVHYLMGNHDNRKNFLDAIERRDGKKPSENKEKIPERLYSVLETPKANFFLLDSLEETNSTPGRLGKTQLDWLETQLDARKDKPAMLFAHHCLDYTSQIVQSPYALLDTVDFWKRIKDRKQVKAYISGHSHVWRHLKKDGVHLIALPTTAWCFDQSQPIGWVLCELKGGGARLTLRSLDQNHSKHNQVLDLTWADR